ncbi:hypothetical protein [Cryobacterium tagatosivorans]|uniref:Uncharacterized protein n=1 Tax=Cryobacterium tagatosivorans TaxID=1259199 RepID=A0A4R8UDS3_9MICO|nr:hypothetical protein [Cryobacterium tagatosivorans]TFB51074.1 hypothetical protein E3O23_09075 [Cryobacterium tagatosivorans]
MPTFYDPGADAREASEALRGLAHATRTFESPQDLYGVLGDLLSGVRSLKQVLDQLATAHIKNRPHAFDDHGDHTIGSKDALAAADELHQAATLIDQAEERLDAAAGAASRVAWHEVPASEAPTIARWINVVFMQGQEADEVLEMIDADGALAGLNHLKYWDYGDETTSAAMENGYVYDAPPSGPSEHELHDGGYHLAYSHAFAHVALYRIHAVDTVDQLPDDARSLAVPSAPSRARESKRVSWFEPASITAVKRQRGLGL